MSITTRIYTVGWIVSIMASLPTVQDTHGWIGELWGGGRTAGVTINKKEMDSPRGELEISKHALGFWLASISLLLVLGFF